MTKCQTDKMFEINWHEMLSATKTERVEQCLKISTVPRVRTGGTIQIFRNGWYCQISFVKKIGIWFVKNLKFRTLNWNVANVTRCWSCPTRNKFAELNYELRRGNSSKFTFCKTWNIIEFKSLKCKIWFKLQIRILTKFGWKCIW